MRAAGMRVAGAPVARTTIAEAAADAIRPAPPGSGAAQQAPATHRPVPGVHPARPPRRRAAPTGRGEGRHLVDNPCLPDDQEADSVAPTPLAATLLQLPAATSAVLDHDLDMRPDPLAFHVLARLDADRRGR